MPNIEDFYALVPDSLREVSGKVFYSGRDAFGSPSPLYILGLNPGGAPEDYPDETVGKHTDKVLHNMPDNWCAFTDEVWGVNGSRPRHPMQKNVLHMLARLGLDCRKVPSSDLVFPRSQNAEKITKNKVEFDRLIKACWPFHQSVIQQLGVSVVVCLGRDAERGTIACLEATNPSLGKFVIKDRFVEDGGLKQMSRTYRNNGSVSVVQLLHPSRFHWTNPKSDPTELVQRALLWSAANPS